MRGARPFRDRRDAGRRLGEALAGLRAQNPVVVGLPRGGVIVAYEVARALGAPLDIALVRKLGAPRQPEFAIGAVGEDGDVLLDSQLADQCGLDEAGVDALVARERGELARRSRRFRGDEAPLPVTGRIVVLVDDGIATGATASAAALALRRRGAKRIVLAVPVGPHDVRERFADVADEIVCLESPVELVAVGQAYADFSQTSDDEVVALLRDAPPGGAPGEEPAC